MQLKLLTWSLCSASLLLSTEVCQVNLTDVRLMGTGLQMDVDMLGSIMRTLSKNSEQFTMYKKQIDEMNL